MKTIKVNTCKFLFRLVFIIGCIIGCIYHVQTICKLYFAYETVVTVSYERSKWIDLPAITVCVKRYNVILKSKLKLTSPWKESIANIESHKTLSEKQKKEKLNLFYYNSFNAKIYAFAWHFL